MLDTFHVGVGALYSGTSLGRGKGAFDALSASYYVISADKNAKGRLAGIKFFSCCWVSFLRGIYEVILYSSWILGVYF